MTTVFNQNLVGLLPLSAKTPQPQKMVVITRLGPPEEGVHHTQPNVGVFVNERKLGEDGTLYISEARISWVGPTGQGFSLEYPHVCLHAVSTDLTSFPSECLYLMIDVRLVDSEGTPTPSSSDAEGEDSGAEASDGGMTEIRFVPADKAALQRMFDSMSHCQTLHPDPADISEEDEEDEEAGDDDAGDGEGAEDEDGMYDDAEEGDAAGANGNGTAPEPMDQ